MGKLNVYSALLVASLSRLRQILKVLVTKFISRLKLYLSSVGAIVANSLFLVWAGLLPLSALKHKAHGIIWLGTLVGAVDTSVFFDVVEPPGL